MLTLPKGQTMLLLQDALSETQSETRQNVWEERCRRAGKVTKAGPNH
jgi:hypothetical protein